jgi:hypothetical protein
VWWAGRFGLRYCEISSNNRTREEKAKYAASKMGSSCG